MNDAEALIARPPAPFRGASTSFAARAGVFGLVLFAITIYALPQYLFPVLEPLRVGVLTAALMTAGLVARWVLGGKAPTAGGVRVVGVVGFCGAAALSPLWSFDPASSRWAAGEALKMGLVYVAACSLLDSPPRLRKVAWAMAIAGCVPAYHAVTFYLQGTDLLEGYRARWLGTFLDPNRLAMALVASSLLLVSLRGRARNPLSLALIYGAIGLQIWGIVVTYSRGGALGLAVGLLVYLLTGARGARGRSVTVVAAVLVGLLFLAPERFWTRTETIASYADDRSAMGRIYAWQTAGEILEDRPLTGVGAAAFVSAWQTYAPGEAGPHAYVAHNLFLEVAAEMGIPALLLFLVLVVACIRGAWRASRPPSPVSEEARGIVAATCGYLVCQMFAGFVLSFFLFILFGLATAAERLARRAASEQAAPIRVRKLSREG